MSVEVDPVTSPCQDCGAIVGAAELHAGWHARLAAATPPMTAQVTVIDPGTGVAVEARPELVEALAALSAPETITAAPEVVAEQPVEASA